MAVTLVVFLVYGAAMLHLDRVVNHLLHQAQETNEFVLKANILRTLTQDYLMSRTERAQKQWWAVYADVLAGLQNANLQALQKEGGLGDAPAKMKIIGDAFHRLMAIGPVAPDKPEGQTARELRNRLSTQLLLATQDLLTRFVDLNDTVDQKLIHTQRLASTIDIVALLPLGLLIFSTGVFLQRSVLGPILKLHDGAEIIGAGNLEYKVGSTSPDEVGELSRAFDRMTASLRQRTDELEAEIIERQRAEAEVKALNLNLEQRVQERTSQLECSRDELLKEMSVRQQAEEALKASETRLRLAQDAAQAGTWEWDLRTNQNFWSAELWKLYGLEPYSYEPSYETWRQIIHPDDREAMEHQVQEAARQGIELRAEWRVRHPDGSQHWLMSRGRPKKNIDGQTEGFIGIDMDITDRKRAEEALQKSEERLRQAAQAGRMFAFEWNPVTDEVIRSEEAGPILGLDGDAAIHDTGQGFFAKIMAEDLETFTHILQNLNPENDRYTANYRIVRPGTGEVIWLGEIARAIFSGEKLQRLYGMTMDITDRKRAEEELQQRSDELARAVAELEQTNAEMERFTYTISHDLKSPLVTISTFLEFLEKDMAAGDSSRVSKDMGYMRTAAAKMSLLLSELLEMSRLGRLMNQPVEVTFQELVQEALNAVAGPLSGRGLEVNITLRRN